MFINVCSSKKKLFSANNENHNIDRQTLDNHNIDRQTLDNHNKDTDTRQSQHRQTDTRQRYNLYLPQAHLITYQKGAYYSGIKILNNLSLGIKNVTQINLKIYQKNFFIHLFISYNGSVP